jgi:hypothetical protein
MIEHPGGCHCRRVTVRYRTRVYSAAWQVRACTCSFCRERQAIYTTDAAGELEFIAQDQEQLLRYHFGTGTADFLMCRTCGSYLGAQTVSAAGRFGIINLRCLPSVADDWSLLMVTDHGSETAERRQQRRQKVWTPLAPDSL